jgi:hypothetical protein
MRKMRARDSGTYLASEAEVDAAPHTQGLRGVEKIARHYIYADTARGANFGAPSSERPFNTRLRNSTDLSNSSDCDRISDTVVLCKAHWQPKLAQTSVHLLARADKQNWMHPEHREHRNLGHYLPEGSARP